MHCFLFLGSHWKNEHYSIIRWKNIKALNYLALSQVRISFNTLEGENPQKFQICFRDNAEFACIYLFRVDVKICWLFSYILLNSYKVWGIEECKLRDCSYNINSV